MKRLSERLQLDLVSFVTNEPVLVLDDEMVEPEVVMAVIRDLEARLAAAEAFAARKEQEMVDSEAYFDGKLRAGRIEELEAMHRLHHCCATGGDGFVTKCDILTDIQERIAALKAESFGAAG